MANIHVIMAVVLTLMYCIGRVSCIATVRGTFCESAGCVCSQKAVTCYTLPAPSLLLLLERERPVDYGQYTIRLLERAGVEASQLGNILSYFTRVTVVYRGQEHVYHTDSTGTLTADGVTPPPRHQESTPTPTSFRSTTADPLLKTTINQRIRTSDADTTLPSEKFKCPEWGECLTQQSNFEEATEKMKKYMWQNRVGVIIVPCIVVVWGLIVILLNCYRIHKKRQRNVIYIGPRLAPMSSQTSQTSDNWSSPTPSTSQNPDNQQLSNPSATSQCQTPSNQIEEIYETVEPPKHPSGPTAQDAHKSLGRAHSNDSLFGVPPVLPPPRGTFPMVDLPPTYPAPPPPEGTGGDKDASSL